MLERAGRFTNTADFRCAAHGAMEVLGVRIFWSSSGSILALTCPPSSKILGLPKVVGPVAASTCSLVHTLKERRCRRGAAGRRVRGGRRGHGDGVWVHGGGGAGWNPFVATVAIDKLHFSPWAIIVFTISGGGLDKQ